MAGDFLRPHWSNLLDPEHLELNARQDSGRFLHERNWHIVVRQNFSY